MILVDASVLLYAHNPSSKHHEACRQWVEAAFDSPSPVGLPWLTVWAFLRISTNRRAFEKPLTMQEAVAIVASWLEAPSVRLVSAGERHWEVLGELLVDAQVTGPLVTDAVLAALAIENGASICTTDRDFTRFQGLPIIDPTR
ncbi:MAG TPA: type II toxin-antitoxin system VapC family toxin [Vicinamibacteria bacterium]|nr:type II toxin-antitoxin system VapC family toxin [Vicinamibacteria bacterium]